MRSKSIFAIAVIAAVLAAIPVYAHHSFSSEYDSAKRLSLKGKMIAFEFVNPHSWIHIEVTNPDGTKTLWKGETPPANALYRYGWTKPMAEEMVKKAHAEVEQEVAAAKAGLPRHAEALADQIIQTVLRPAVAAGGR